MFCYTEGMERDSLLKSLALPLVLLGIVLVAYLSWYVLDLPQEGELIASTESVFLRYGLIMVPLGAFLEALMLVGWYVPGGTVVLLGVIFSGDDISRVILVVILGTVGLLAGYICNYILGKYGWYKLGVRLGLGASLDDAKTRLERRGARAIFFTYWQPGLASLTSTAAGILHMPFKKFLSYSIPSLVFWDIMWGLVAYFFGDEAMDVISLRFVVLIIFLWIGWTVLNRWKYLRHEKE